MLSHRFAIFLLLLLFVLCGCALFVNGAEQLTDGVTSSQRTLQPLDSPMTFVLTGDAKKDLVIDFNKVVAGGDFWIAISPNEIPDEWEYTCSNRIGPGITHSTSRCATSKAHSDGSSQTQWYISVYLYSDVPYSFSIRAESKTSILRSWSNAALAAVVIFPSLSVICCCLVLVACCIGCFTLGQCSGRGGSDRGKVKVYHPPTVMSSPPPPYGVSTTGGGYTSMQYAQQHLMSPSNMYAPSAQPIQQQQQNYVAQPYQPPPVSVQQQQQQQQQQTLLYPTV